MRAPRNKYNMWLEYVWNDAKGIGSWFLQQAEKYHCKPDWQTLVYDNYPEPETSRQEAECWIFMWIWNRTDNMPNDKLSGYTVITQMLVPLVLVCLLLIYIVIKLLCCILCRSKAAVV